MVGFFLLYKKIEYSALGLKVMIISFDTKVSVEGKECRLIQSKQESDGTQILVVETLLKRTGFSKVNIQPN